jgi:hypothetical protein
MGLQYCVMLLNSSQREALFIVGAFLLELSRYRSNTLVEFSVKSLYLYLDGYKQSRDGYSPKYN